MYSIPRRKTFVKRVQRTPLNTAPPAGDGRGRNPARGGRLQAPPRGQAPAPPPASRRRAGGARAGDERFYRESDRSGRARPQAAPPARRRGSTHTAGVRVPPAERRATARSGGGGTGGRKGASYPPQGTPPRGRSPRRRHHRRRPSEGLQRQARHQSRAREPPPKAASHRWERAPKRATV